MTRAEASLVLLTLWGLLTCVAGCAGDAAAQASPDECAACHLSDYRGAPKHVGQKPTKCAVCHTNYAWHPTHTDHPFFALDGAHAKASCFDCHKGNPPLFDGTPKECVGCHRADYDKSQFPGHSSFPLTCDTCHSVTAWKPPLPTFVPREGSEPTDTADRKRKTIPTPPEPRRRGAPATTAQPAAPATVAPQHTSSPKPKPYTPPATTPYTPPATTPYTPPATTPYTPPPPAGGHTRPDTVSGASRRK